MTNIDRQATYTGTKDVAAPLRFDVARLEAYLAANAARKVRIEHLIRPGATIVDNPHHFVVVRVDGDRVSLEVVAAPAMPYTPYGKRRINLN